MCIKYYINMDFTGCIVATPPPHGRVLLVRKTRRMTTGDGNINLSHNLLTSFIFRKQCFLGF